MNKNIEYLFKMFHFQLKVFLVSTFSLVFFYNLIQAKVKVIQFFFEIFNLLIYTFFKLISISIQCLYLGLFFLFYLYFPACLSLDYISNVLATSVQVDFIYLDLAKAFDSVNHKILLFKLSKFSICGKLFI